MDRANVGAALVNGMIRTMKLTPTEQALITSMFYLFYITLELPANVLLKKLKPRVWFCTLAICWSITCMLQALAKSALVMIILRTLLGAFDAGFSPGIIAYLPYWYTREEIGSRMSIFFASLPLSGIIGSPLAAALVSIKSNLHPFQMIFLVEGGITLICGIVAIFLIQDYPETCTMLTNEERAVLLKKLSADQGLASKTTLNFKTIINSMLDWKTVVYCMGSLGIANGLITYGYFGPTLMVSLGYSGVNATYLTILPSALGVVAIIGSIFIPKRIPMYVVIVSMMLIATTFGTIMAFAKGKTIRLIAFTLGGFTNPAFPIFLSWMSINQGGIGKRLVVSAVCFAFGNAAGAVVPFMFTTKYSPSYTIGFVYNIACGVIGMVLIFFMAQYFKSENARRDKSPVDITHLSEDEQMLLYDAHPNFRYTL
ncbi:putative tartrate transporter [Zancudomyces culisetae]|uniref:Putative tartrate transporter n=1 Tax=Zancudomyces culisetae TaxID=1213189 RepID=A0A1R1PDV5_ZANCU|nr:putative tartrate transporter [Zancudomyces culisetae]OMH80240.1 putative tartrate transporter [Zancudomyces culisetae]|eukprot:OMH79052.1 putative tartrate transporter [Zancudomyces culisetae]